MRTTGRVPAIGSALAMAVALLTVAAAAQADNGPNHRTLDEPPIQLGISGINARAICSTATLGALVRDASNNTYILSNNHVLAGSNTASPGEDIVQPGSYEYYPACQTGPVPGNVVAKLTAYEELRMGGATNTVDAAIAREHLGRVNDKGEILDIGAPNAATMPAFAGQRVKKSGRTTGLTTGRVSSVTANVNVNYGVGTAYFTNQVMISSINFGLPGDSGSLIVENQGNYPRAVALLFAIGLFRPNLSFYTLGNPIGPVLSLLSDRLGPGSNLQLVGSGAVVSGQAAPAPSAREVAGAAARARHEAGLRALPEVVGVGVGEDGALEVYLAGDSEQGRRPIPPQLDGVPVRAVVTGTFYALPATR